MLSSLLSIFSTEFLTVFLTFSFIPLSSTAFLISSLISSAVFTTFSKELSFFAPHYNIDYNGWHIDGTLTEWNYTIVDESYVTVAIIRKEIFNFTDTYVIDVKDPENALDVLMFVLAIDAEKCTRNKRQNN